MIILVLLAIVLGVVFVMKFNAIDCAIFNHNGDEEDHFGYGVEALFLSIIFGAVAGGASFIREFFDLEFDISILHSFTILAMAMLLVYSLLMPIIMESKVGAMIGKFLFLCVSIAIGFAVGVAGSVVILCVATLCAALYIISLVLLGSGKEVKVKDSWGNTKTLTNSFGGKMRDSWGNAYEKDGDKYYKED